MSAAGSWPCGGRVVGDIWAPKESTIGEFSTLATVSRPAQDNGGEYFWLISVSLVAFRVVDGTPRMKSLPNPEILLTGGSTGLVSFSFGAGSPKSLP